MSIKNKNVVVTGAGGFIASHLTEELVRRGANVKAFVHYNSRNDWGLLELAEKDLLDKVEVISGDVTDPFFVNSVTKDTDIVFHLAALIGIPYSYVAPEHYVNVNVKGTLNVLQACLDNGVGKMVHTSTSETYGTAEYTPIDEKHPLKGQSPYSASKIGADKMAESYYRSFDLPVATIRPFNTFGPRQSARAIIPTIISQALTRDEIHVGSLTPVRDMTYVKDTVNGFIEVGLSERSSGETINVGTGSGATIGVILEKILKILGKEDIPVIEEQNRVRPGKSEVMELICDNSKAKDLLNWSPEYSLDNGLKETIEWMQEYTKLYKPDMYVI
ncbi:SDR family NAD(P)-dependent oxidoreductase [Methanococcoides burtonii]|uniref:Nucleotide sugar dehydratase n=1 Tax=Methanococcoides burtonii (strain DSM 6242 / NBRC 107633 / OCM 468 / ACE-M) TaxID=259564 RepID=Q12VN9_METBU|nr:SDR family NAD(P)-dependent oxidoreductase [Methanococcoides burtonii]ABE52487.1 nucleotide sugar dehydratase [Methanococcoides burtonii DSM 6242]